MQTTKPTTGERTLVQGNTPHAASKNQPASKSEEPMMAKTEGKDSGKRYIDDIKNFRDMLEIFRLLGLHPDSETLSLSQMKEEAKAKIQEQSSGGGQYFNGTTGLHVISQAKKRDMMMRKELKKYYSKVDECLEKIDEDARILVLNSYTEDFFKVHNEQKERLEKPNYHLLVAGESSAGKSTLINLLLGEELLPKDILHATSTICELKYGKKRRLVVHYKSIGDPQPEEIQLKSMEECGKTYGQQITPYIYLDQDTRKEGSKYQKVELFWPNELLQEGVVIIDTPGIGESDDMDQVLMSYLPSAFAFINVLDVSHVGGLQNDYKKTLTKILKSTQSFGSRTEHLSKCSLFVGNKWDLIAESDRDRVKKYVANELSNCWQDANLSHQIVYISAGESILLQQYGAVTSDFHDLLENIKQMILRAIDIRLYDHWGWLDLVLSEIFTLADFFARETKFIFVEKNERMIAVESRIRDIKEKKRKVKEDIKKRLTCETNVFLQTLGEYVVSSEFRQRFCDWSDASFVPPIEDTWSNTKANVVNAVKNRLQEFLDQWESVEQYHADLHRKLVDEFLARLNIIEQELQGGDNAHDVARQVNYLNNRSQMSKTAKFLIGVTSPVWIPVGLVGSIIGMPFVAGFAMKTKLSEQMKLSNYQENPRDYLKNRSEKFLASSSKVEEVVNEYVIEKMSKTNGILSTYYKMLPRLIKTEWKMVSQLRKDRRSNVQVLQQYDPIMQESKEIREQMMSLGKKVCPATVNTPDLDWKQDRDSCLREGEFSLVYRGKLRNGGRYRKLDSNTNLDVAVKVFKKQFDDPNSRFYLNEETTITSLNHENVLKFYGTIKLKVSYMSNEYKFAFVMKYCEHNLKDIILKDRSVTPGRAEDLEVAVGVFLNWVVEIAAGLNYIHDRGLVHRHLKLENILMDENFTAKIGDVGIVGTFKETERSIIYLAPEVLEDRMNCTKAADVYSFGIVMWEMWHGKQAFEKLVPLDKATFQEKIFAGYRPEQDDSAISLPGPHQVMKSCWATDPYGRISSKECSGKLRQMWESRSKKSAKSENH